MIRGLFPCFLIAFAAFSGHASLVQPGDGPYYRLRGERINYVYDANAREIVPQITGYMESIRALYDSSYAWKLDETEDLILASPRQQIANAMATVIPNAKSYWFPSGPVVLEQMAESSWFLALATHETAHLYQLNAKSEFPAAVHSVLGNTMAFFPFLWPIFVQPNIFTPHFLVEGNAVLNESRANMGGRLHSGEVRALVLAQIQAGQIDPTRLINREFRFPYGTDVYTQGGYFQAHLATKYGVDKTNQFFLAQGSHYLWPLILNKTFRDHFGASYPQEIREYTREMEALARNQKGTNGERLVETQFISRLNHDGQKVYFLSSDGIEPLKLHVIQKSIASESVRTVDLPMGKPFFDGEKVLVAASLQHDLHHIEYSLYGEAQAFDERFRGQIVTDWRGGKTVAVDAKNSWLENKILLNGEPYDIGHSLPILSEDGSVYYFRQNGTERVLYKNRIPVFKYDGFYGKLTEVGADGSVYFIANTDYGSSLYKYKDQEIWRMFDSDQIVDAAALDDRRFLVSEVFADGHRAIISEAAPRPARPAVYSYGFPSYNLLPQKSPDPQQVKTEEREYNSLRELRYSATDFNSWWETRRGLGLYLRSRFIDPLEYQLFGLGFSGTASGTQYFLGEYAFTKYLPQIGLRYIFQKQLWTQWDDRERFAHNQQVDLTVSLPLLRWQEWDAVWNFSPYYQLNQSHDDPSAPFPTYYRSEQEATYGISNALMIRYERGPDPDLGMYPWREWLLGFQHNIESEPGSWRKKYNTSLVQTKYQHGFKKQIYASVSGNVAWAENYDVDISYDPQPFSMDIHIPRLVNHDEYTVKTASSARLEVAKVFNLSSYSPRIPLSLSRLAPFVVAQGIFLDDQAPWYREYPANIFEYGYGIDLQLLFLHSVPMKLRVLHGIDTRNPDVKDSSFAAKLEGRF